MRLNLRNQRLGLKLAVNRQSRVGGSLWVPADFAGTYAAFDLTDPATLWQDAAGTVPVTTLGHPIARADDISGNGRHMTNVAVAPMWGGVPATYGPELVVNGGFATDTDWTKSAGTTITGGVAVLSSVATSTTALSQSISLTQNKIYRAQFTLISRTSGQFNIRFTGGATLQGSTRSADGTYTQYFRATANHTAVEIRVSGTGTTNIDNVSVQEVLTVSGSMGLLNDGTNTALWGTSTNTLSFPSYIAIAATRLPVEQATNGTIVTFGQSNSSRHSILTGTTQRYSAAILGPGGNATLNSANNQWALGQAAVVESRAVDSTIYARINNSAEVSTAHGNTSISFTNVAHGFSANGVGGSITYQIPVHAAIFCTQVPTGDDLTNMQNWLAERAGVTL